MTDLLELAERVEAATGPNRSLDTAIAFTLMEAGVDLGLTLDEYKRAVAPNYTASLDAAMTLVPEGAAQTPLYRRTDEWPEGFRPRAAVSLIDTLAGGAWTGVSLTVPLALCAAALRARAATIEGAAAVSALPDLMRRLDRKLDIQRGISSGWQPTNRVALARLR